MALLDMPVLHVMKGRGYHLFAICNLTTRCHWNLHTGPLNNVILKHSLDLAPGSEDLLIAYCKDLWPPQLDDTHIIRLIVYPIIINKLGPAFGSGSPQSFQWTVSECSYLPTGSLSCCDVLPCVMEKQCAYLLVYLLAKRRRKNLLSVSLNQHRQRQGTIDLLISK